MEIETWKQKPRDENSGDTNIDTDTDTDTDADTDRVSVLGVLSNIFIHLPG